MYVARTAKEGNSTAFSVLGPILLVHRVKQEAFRFLRASDVAVRPAYWYRHLQEYLFRSSIFDRQSALRFSVNITATVRAFWWPGNLNTLQPNFNDVDPKSTSIHQGNITSGEKVTNSVRSKCPRQEPIAFDINDIKIFLVAEWFIVKSSTGPT